MRAAVDVRVTGDHIPFTQVPQGQGVARVQPEPDDMGQNPQVVAFIAELQHWRQVNGCSQKAVARLVGYTPSYVSKVERGERRLDLVQLRWWCAALGTTATAFVREFERQL